MRELKCYGDDFYFEWNGGYVSPRPTSIISNTVLRREFFTLNEKQDIIGLDFLQFGEIVHCEAILNEDASDDRCLMVTIEYLGYKQVFHCLFFTQGQMVEAML